MRLMVVALLAGSTLCAQVTLAPTDDRAEVALQAAIHTEIVDGNLKAAIQQYEAVTRSGNRKAAAQALVKMGRCYEKLGDAQSKAAYERVIRDYTDQQDAVRQAQRSLAAMNIKPPSPVTAADPHGEIGWYNGDWCHCAEGLRNQIIIGGNHALVYDDFVVPAGGWTIVGVFSHNFMRQVGATEAYWEIRTGMSEGKGGKVVASKKGPATIQQQTDLTPTGYAEYEVRVDGLNVNLGPGRYWLAVAPISNGHSYIHPTSGKNAIGTPRGDNGESYADFPEFHRTFMKTEAASVGFHDSSLGVRIAPGK